MHYLCFIRRAAGVEPEHTTIAVFTIVSQSLRIATNRIIDLFNKQHQFDDGKYQNQEEQRRKYNVRL